MKYTQKTYDKLYMTKLANRLGEMGLAFQELRYISERDFSKWRYVGKDLTDYTRLRLAAEGLSFGEYTIDFYKEHKDEIIAQSFPKKKEPTGTFDWQAFRAEAAKDIFCVLIGKYQNHSFGQPSTISLCEEAIGKADELIKQLKENGRSEKKESV